MSEECNNPLDKILNDINKIENQIRSIIPKVFHTLKGTFTGEISFLNTPIVNDSPVITAATIGNYMSAVTGATGLTGATGDPGPVGSTGATGPGASVLIPYASRSAITLSTTPLGNPNNCSFLAFGSNTSHVGLDSPLNLSGSSNYGITFSTPTSGKITGLTAYFSTTTSINLNSDLITITMAIYSSSTPNDLFTLIPGAVINLLPDLKNVVAIGNVSYGSLTGLSLSFTANTRLLCVWYCSGANSKTIDGYASGGMTLQLD